METEPLPLLLTVTLSVTLLSISIAVECCTRLVSVSAAWYCQMAYTVMSISMSASVTFCVTVSGVVS